MSSTTTQLSFSLRVSSGVKTVHLLGSWDNYAGQLPLSKDKSSKSGSWKGTFRFPGATLQPGQRYWYYYIIDGYHTSHNPSEPSTVEPTTGRELNVLDVPKSKSSSGSSSSRSSHSKSESKSSSRHSMASSKEKSSKRTLPKLEIAKGRPLSMSQIKAPKPTTPHATRHILDADYDYDQLADHLAATGLDEYDYADGVITEFGTNSSSPISSSDSDLSYRSSSPGSSLGSSVSGYSTPSSDYSSCTCERYALTRTGDRVRIDCGGRRCGYDDSCSSSSGEESEYSPSARRNGIVVRS